MSVERWLAARTPRPPEALASRMTALLATRRVGAQSTTSVVLMEAAESLLRRLLREGCATRESALDLLVVDALVTYAFEAAAEEPELIAERTQEAMLRIGALAAEVSAGVVAASAPDAAR